MSLIQCGKVLLLAFEYDSLLDNTKVQRSNRKALFFKYFQVRQSHCVNRPLYGEHHWSLYRDQCVEINGEQRVTTRRVNPKRAGGNPPPSTFFLLYLSRLSFFRAETSWIFFFKPCAQFKTIFLKIEPRVMTRRCVIERWVQRKTDQKLIFNGNYTQIVFFVFRIHFHYVLFYLFGLFGARTCVSILWHTSLPKNATLLEKIAKNHDFGDFWWFSCFWHDVTYDVTVASYKVCLYFFWYQ